MTHPYAADPRDAEIEELRRKIRSLEVDVASYWALVKSAQDTRNQVLREIAALRRELGIGGITRAVIAEELAASDFTDQRDATRRLMHGGPF